MLEQANLAFYQRFLLQKCIFLFSDSAAIMRSRCLLLSAPQSSIILAMAFVIIFLHM